MFLKIYIFVVIVIFSPTNLISKNNLPKPETWEKEVKQLLYDKRDILMDGSDIMSLETPYRALDAATVPVTVKFNENQKDDNFIKSLTLIVDENPSPIVGKFEFSPKIGNATLSTRIRVDKYTYVRAIAEKNNGAFFNNHRIRVSKKNRINECLFVTSGKINNLFELPIRKTGCAALDLAYVACGRYDGFFQNNLNLWDIAAGLILVQEAGGLINEIDLKKIKNIKVIASNVDIMSKFQEKILNF